VPARDRTALAAALRSLAQDGATRQRLAAAARAHALTLTPARMADAYLHVYEQAAQRSAGGPLSHARPA
jgi:hypothetical protein